MEVARTSVGSATPASRGLAYENVTFRTADGVRLSGWYIPSRNGGAVVVLHGASSTRSAVLDQAAVIARHGYGALLFDARGHGRSDGNGMDLGWYGDLDVRGAVSYLARRSDVEPTKIATLGESMGGEEALGAAATDRRIRAVVAEGAQKRVTADLGYLSGGAETWLETAMSWTQDHFADLLTSAHPPTSLRRAIMEISPRPVLLIASKQGAERVANRYLRNAAPRTVTLWELPDTEHTKGLSTHPREWTMRITDFLDRALS